MAKILNHYENNLDKAWYESSNILYSECDDNENDLKTLRITFKGGRTYAYYNVKVTDYLLFREDPSQGQAFNRLIKQHQCERVEDKNVDAINEELQELLNKKDDDFSVLIDKEKNEVSVLNNGNVVSSYQMEGEKVGIGDLKDMLTKLKIKTNE